MNDTYFIRWKSQVSGPFSPNDIKAMLLEGQITKHHQVSGNKVEWTPLQETDAFRADCRPRLATNQAASSAGVSAAPGQSTGKTATIPDQVVDHQKLRLMPLDNETAQERWYYAENGKTEGPVTMWELRQLIDTGTIQKNYPICKEGEERWVRAGDAFSSLWHTPAPSSYVQQPPQVQVAQCTKSKVTAGVLALCLGGLGVHKFYLGMIGQGILYLLFCWTYIPAIIAFIEAIHYLTMTEEAFCQKYGQK